MGFRLSRGAGNVNEPATILMPASGVIHAGGVVIRGAANNVLAPAAATTVTTTNVFGVALDYAQGNSDTFVRVIPFTEGQLWEADTVNAISTASVLFRHSLADDLYVRNITGALGGDGESIATGVFLCLGVTGATTGSGKVLGTFLKRTPTKSDSVAFI